MPLSALKLTLKLAGGIGVSGANSSMFIKHTKKHIKEKQKQWR